MLDYTATGTYVLVVTLATLFVMILVARQQRAQKDIAIWLISGLVGILLGAAGAAAIVQGMGYELAEKFNAQQVSEGLDEGEEDEGEVDEGEEDEGEVGGGDTSGGREGRDGMGGPGVRGGGRVPSPRNGTQ